LANIRNSKNAELDLYTIENQYNKINMDSLETIYLFQLG